MWKLRKHLCIAICIYFCTSLSSSMDLTETVQESNRSSTTEETVGFFGSTLTTEAAVGTEFHEANDSSVLKDLDFVSTTVPSEESGTSPSISPKITTAQNDFLRTSQIFTTASPKTNTSKVLEKWLHFENITKIFAKDSIKGLLRGLMSGTGNLNISASCRRDVLKLLIGLQNIKAWAFSFIDASGKFIDGMLAGTMANLGEYDQCVDIKATNDRKGKNFGKVMFTGQYCALDIKPPLPPKPQYYKLNDIVDELKDFASGDNIINEAAKAAHYFHFLKMRLGICVPSGCIASDIQQVIDIVGNETRWEAKVKRCELKQENEFTPLIIGAMTAMSFFGFLFCLGSLVEWYHRYAQKKITNSFLEILACFSLISNFKKLINTTDANDSMSCLHGMRFLSISWIILGHTYLNTNYVIQRGLRKGLEFQKDFFFQAVVNASVAVDTFFFIGGLLVCYVTVKLVRDAHKPFNLFLYVFHRLFRLLPVYIMVIVFIYLAPVMGSGPIYHDTVDGFVEACTKNWWTNVLFVNNFINTDQICLPQSWYVACDMQLYIAALIVILPILRWPWIGLSIASLGIVASVAGTIALTYINEYPPTMLFIHPDAEQRLAYWANAYFKPYSHAGPYCIGLIVGYILVTHPKMKLSKMTRIIGWVIATASNMSVLYGVYEWNVGRDPELIETLLYSGLHRVVWTFGIAWVVINCSIGQGGIVNYILGWKFWIPLGRLTYTIYLIHPIVQIAALGNIRMRVQTTHYFAVWIYFGHLMITIGSAFAASMLVEAPFIGLEKIFMRVFVTKRRTTANGHAQMPSGSTTPKSESSEGSGNRAERIDPVSHL